jgi:hypothetical protein
MSQPTSNLPWACVDQETGSDTNPGTQARPMSTIGAASDRYPNGPLTVLLRTSEDQPYEGSVSLERAQPLAIRPWDTPTWYLVGTAAAQYAIRAVGAGLVELHHFNVTGSGVAGIRVGDVGFTAGHLKLYDGVAEGDGSGVQTWKIWDTFEAWRVASRGVTNDGFNVHSNTGLTPVAKLYDCSSDGSGDEAASNHEDTVMELYGFVGRNCLGGGAAAINNAVMSFYRSYTWPFEPSLLEANGRVDDLPPAYPLVGGAGWWDNASGVIDGLIVRNNIGPGAFNEGTGTVTEVDLVSEDNTVGDAL